MKFSSVAVEPVWPWPVVLLVAAGMLALIVVGYRRALKNLPSGQRKLLLGLRLFAWAIVVFALLRPSLEWSEKDERTTVLAFLYDRSRSMGIKDGPGGVSRRESLIKTLADANAEIAAIGKVMENKQFDFDKELAPVEKAGPETNGPETAIGFVLDQLVQETRGKQLQVLLFSDGAQRAIPPHDLNPRVVARRLSDLQVPVHTVGFGSTGFESTSVDLAIEDLDVNSTVFEKNTVVVGAKLRALGAANRDVVVRLLLEEPGSKSGPGEMTKMKVVAPPLRIKPAQNQELLPVELSFIAEHPGEFRLTMEAVPFDDEPQKSNNTLTTYLSVLKGGVSVAYFDTIRPEQKFIRRVNESPDIQLNFKPIRILSGAGDTKLDADWFAPGKYDVYIIGDVPARIFGKDLLRKLSRTVEQGAGLMMLGGFHTFGAGGYGDTPLADLLPVIMQPNELQPDDRIDPSQQILQPLSMVPTTQGVHGFVMRLDTPAKNLDHWRSLAPLQGANKFTGLKPLAQVLAETPQHVPLLISQEVGRARTLAFAADTTYQWVLAGQLEDHQRFWQQALLWLAHKDEQGDNSVWVKLNHRRFHPGQPVEMIFGARDQQKRPIDEAQFKVSVRLPNGKSESVMPVRGSQESTGRFLNTHAAGEYVVSVEALQNDKSLGFATLTRFLVYEQDLELHNPAADLSLLQEISRITAGSHVPPEQLGELLARLRTESQNVSRQRVTKLSVWDNWPLLLLFVVVMTAEWTLRKKRGLV